MMLRELFALLIFLFLSVMVSAQENPGAAGYEWACSAAYEGQSLDVLNRSNYIPANTIADFEAACSVTVSYTEYEHESLVYDTLTLGNPGYDLVIATSITIPPLLEQDLLVPLNFELIPNYPNAFASFRSPAYDPYPTYTLPYAWGSLGVIYRREAFPDGIHSWQTVWDNTGTAAWIDDSRAILGLALRHLDYSPNSSQTEQVFEARDFLGSAAAHILGIGSEEQLITLLLDGDIDMAIAYSDTARILFERCACADFNYSVPDEGSYLYVNRVFVPVDSDAEDLAMTFIDYLLDPQIGADMNNMGMGLINHRSKDLHLLSERFADVDGFNLSSRLMGRMFQILPLPEAASAAYELAWADLRSVYTLTTGN